MTKNQITALDSIKEIYQNKFAKLIKDEVVANRDNGLKTLIKPQPLGVCLCLTAWKFPIALVIRKIAPALAAGCSVIIKPSEETPGTAIEVIKIDPWRKIGVAAFMVF